MKDPVANSFAAPKKFYNILARLDRGVEMADQIPFCDVSLATNPEPRCPCVLLLDVSASMGEVVENAGERLGRTNQHDGKMYDLVSSGVTRIDKVNEGLQIYQNELMKDRLAAQRVEVSVITFGSKVETLVPFVGATEFDPPKLTINGSTNMGEGILKAIEAISERKKQYRDAGLHYYRPWIFFITDGEPTDSWQLASEKIKEGEKNKSFAFFAVGVEGANFDILRKISVREPLKLKGCNFKEMFVWLSQSQRNVSHSNPGQEEAIKLESPAGWASL